MRLQYEKCMANKAFTGAIQKLQEQYMIVDKNVKNYIKQKLKQESSNAQKLILKLDTLSPLKTLARGYSIITVEENITKSIAQLKPGVEIQIRMQDGKAKAKVI